MSKNSRKPGSSRGSSSGKKMVGFGANVDDGQTPLTQTKREGTKSRKGKGKHTVLQGHECAGAFKRISVKYTIKGRALQVFKTT